MGHVGGYRPALRSNTIMPIDLPDISTQSERNLPLEYTLEPTVPNPFYGTLEASLDALLRFGSTYPELKSVIDTLCQEVRHDTDWLGICHSVLLITPEQPLIGRYLLEEVLFLVTRTLLPEQIRENRRLMYRAYIAKRNLSSRFMLRYDMLRSAKTRPQGYPIVVNPRPTDELPHPPSAPTAHSMHLAPLHEQQVSRSSPVNHLAPSVLQLPINPKYPHRRPLLPNILPTLLATDPLEPHCNQKLSDAMRHHVTELDIYLLYNDEQVAGWDTRRLLVTLISVLLQWQWLRENTELMADMDVNMWEGLTGKADDCEWVKEIKGMVGRKTGDGPANRRGSARH